MKRSLLAFPSLLILPLLWSAFAAPPIHAAPRADLPAEKPAGKLEQVARFSGAMPTGVTVSARNCIFVNFPRWGDKVPFTVAEVKNGRAVAFPSAGINRFGKEGGRASLSTDTRSAAGKLRRERFVSVQSVVVDARDRLWILDTGSIAFGPTASGGPKLVAVDLKTNRVVRRIYFPRTVALPTTYLNDVRFDLRRGAGGTAYITDSGAKSPNGIIVVDLASGRSWRRLSGHASVKAEAKFVPIVEGRAVMQRQPGKTPEYVDIGSDGIAISHDGARLYYCPLASRELYSVSTAALADPLQTNESVAATVIHHGDKGASDGLESDAQGRIYVTNYEHNAIMRRYPNGLYETLVHDDRALWPDTLSLARNGSLYFIANQLHRQKNFHNGKDLRRKPYSLFRVKVGATPVLLK
ncbi:MAG TPA: L-dopachrome tautomerase-related protein [Abditibacteriaceae bacterium]|jgi:sugar lactone lactonase YvrE